MTHTATATSPGWGTCPACGRWMRLRKDGRLRHHGGPVQAMKVTAGRAATRIGQEASA